jgi:hypothetical protein
MAMHAPSAEDAAAIQRALALGQVTVTDPATGYHRSLLADCPEDGHSATVWRIVRGTGHAITDLTMRCTACGREFTASSESLYLH